MDARSGSLPLILGFPMDGYGNDVMSFLSSLYRI